MKGKSGILVLGLLLVLLSYLLQWYGEGGNATQLALDDERVNASLDYLAADDWNRTIATDGEVQRTWVSADSRGHKVSLIVALNGYPWRASVLFSQDGMPLETAVQLSGGLPLYTRRVGVALAAFWLVAGVLGPRIFGRKCPFCPGSFLRPVYLKTEEMLVYPGGFDDNSDSLSPIVRRDFVCQQCGYRRVTYCIPTTSRPGKVFRFPLIVAHATPKQTETYQKMLDQWFVDNPRTTRFHTQDEWRTFYDELKASEHEQRPGIR